MSKTVDERVVEMRFDNANFEKNASTSMATLAKLKKSLNLTGASKGLENISTAAKKVDMSGLGTAVDTVSKRFSALEIVGATTLMELTRQAMNAGKRIASALTIQPVTTGLKEYETKMNAIQVIQANTRGKNTMEDITKALDELNRYADQTIYNFAQMTSNIGKFVAQGLNVQEATDAVKGMANLAAASGASPEDMARATYQMSQALGGTIRKIDWNSLRNANMATMELKNTLIDLARVNGIAIDDMMAKHGSLENTLEEGWLSGDLFTKAMNIYSGVYSEAELKAQGFTDDQIANFMDLAKTAQSAATEVKTLSQLWGVLKETAQSGWTQTWELIFGDFVSAKAMFTEAQNYFSGIINAFSDARNKIIEGAMASPFGKLAEKIEKVTGATEAMVEVTKDYSEIVNKVINGDFGNGQARWDKLTEAGYDWAKVQNLVNEKLGDSTRHTEQLDDTQKKANKTQAITIEQLTKMSDVQLKNLGFTKKEIKAFKELKEQSEKTGIPINELIKDMDQLSGRNLLINSLKNAWSGVLSVCIALKDAWKAIFPPMTSERLYDIIAALHNFSTNLVMSERTAKNLTRTLKGVFAIIDIVATIAGGAFKIAFEIVGQLLKYFNTSLLEVTALIGDAVVGFRDWMDSVLDFTKAFEILEPYIESTVELIKQWVSEIKQSESFKNFTAAVEKLTNGIRGMMESFKQSEVVSKFVSFIVLVASAIHSLISEVRQSEAFIQFSAALSKITNAIGELIKKAMALLKNEEFKAIGGNIIDGLANGLYDGSKKVIEAILDLGTKLILGICKVLGIHSPSREFYDIGTNITEGLINGLKNGATAVWEFVKGIGEKCVEMFNAIDFGKILAVGLGIGTAMFAKKLFDLLDLFASPLEGVGDVLSGLGDMLVGIGKSFKAKAFERNSKAIMNLAIAIAVLVASVTVLTFLDTGKLWGAIGAIAALAVILGALSVAASKMRAVDFKNFAKLSVFLLGASASILLLAISMKLLAKLSIGNCVKAVVSFAAVLAAFVGVMIAFGHFVSADQGRILDKAGLMLVKMAAAMMTMTFVIKRLAKMKVGDIVKGIAVMGAFELLFGAMVMISSYGGRHADKAGSMFLKMSIAFLVMAGVIKIVSGFKIGEIFKGIIVMTAFAALCAGMMWVSQFAGAEAAKAGTMLLLMSLAFAVVASVIKQVAGLDDKTVLRGLAIITVIEALFAGIIAVSKFAGKNAAKAGVMLLLMAGAMVILSAVLFIISEMDPSGLWRALGVVTVLELLFAGLIAVTHFAKGCKSTLIMLTVAVGILAAAVAALSFIDPKELGPATAALSALMAMFALMTASTKFVKKKTLTTLATMLGIVAGLAAIIALLSLLDVDSVLNVAASLSLLMLSFAGSLAIMGVAGKISKSVQKTLVPMMAVFIGMAAILGVMSVLNAEGSISNAIALSLLLNAMAAAMVVLKFAKVSMKSIGTLALMGLVVAEIAAILGVMSYLDVNASMVNVLALSTLLLAMSGALLLMNFVGPHAIASVGALALLGLVVAELAAILGVLAYLNLEASMTTVLALSTLLLAMSASLLLLNFVGPQALVGVGAMALLGLVVAELAAILGVMQNFNINPSIETAKALSILLLSMSAALVVLGVAGMMGAAAFIGIAALATMIAGIGGLIIAIGALMTEFPQLEEFLNKGIPILEKIGYAIGSFVGNIVGGFLAGTMAGLPEIGSLLSEFITNAMPFIEGIKMADSSTLAGSAILVGTILALTAADIIAGMTTFATGGVSFSKFGTELSEFITEAKPFIEGIKNVDPSSVKAAAALAGVILCLTAADILEGLTSWFTGGSSFSEFGKELAEFAPYLAEYGKAVAGINVDAVNASANATKALSEVAANLPNSGGVVGWFAGENDMDTFGAQLTAFGMGLVGYSAAVSGLKVEPITISVEATKALSEVAANLPNSGGVAGFFAGENDMGTFGTQLVLFGGSLLSYSKSVEGLKVAPITTSVLATKALFDLSKDIPLMGGLFSYFTADNDFKTFGEQISSFGAALNSYATSVAGLSADSISNSISAAKKLIELVNGMADIDTSGVKSFKSALKNLANAKLDDFVNAFSGASSKLSEIGSSMIDSIIAGINAKQGSMTDAINTVVQNMIMLISFQSTSLHVAGSALVDGIILGIQTSGGTVTTAVSDLIIDLATSVSNKAIMFFVAGGELIDGLLRGIQSKSETVKTTIVNIVTSSVMSIRNYRGRFYSAGAYLASGFAAGISKNSYLATAKSRAMAKAAAEAAEAELDINSPSRVFYGIGDYAGQGFVNALVDNTKKAYTAGREMASSARTGLSNAMGRIADLINSDMDTQPTIRPVLDLSEVESGMGTISDLFSMGSSVGLLTNVGAISSMMSTNSQNGQNDDVVSAINKLRSDLGNVGNSYNIAGITYDDGSNVSGAVQSLMRAAKMERRI